MLGSQHSDSPLQLTVEAHQVDVGSDHHKLPVGIEVLDSLVGLQTLQILVLFMFQKFIWTPWSVHRPP